ncbi:hypothetical protein HPB50_006459 [Hyalomma asiaticum]|uniref:Uncharacterized protein n=1 Tax=Hyalomma asiaticum TaxID=266040 RepID=A0ACB7RJC4_HYAAI|nr:hypothetical protein HPB50_006459 [Hyalomma asiaticum]
MTNFLIFEAIFLIAIGSGNASGSGPPRIFEFGFPPEVALGDEVVVACAVKKGTSGPYTIAWRKDGKDVENDGHLSVFGQSKTSSVLRITGVQPEDVGNYTCAASNSFGSDSFTAQLVIHAPPKVGDLSFPSDVALGDEAIVTCVVKKGSQGPYHITWAKDGREVVSDAGGRVSVSTPSKSSATIRIGNLRADDVGNYTCTARNRFGSDSVTASLVVHAPPKLQSAGFPSEVSLGDDIIATCIVKKGSSGPYRMTWHKDGDELRNTNRVGVVPHGNSIVLRVEGIEVDDIGNYTCSATNDFGTDVLTLSLVVTVSALLQRPPAALSSDFPEEQNMQPASSRSPPTGVMVTVAGHFVFFLSLQVLCDTASAVGLVEKQTWISFSALLTAPKLGRFDFPPDVALGDEIVETCVVKKGSVGPYRILLQKDDKPIESGDRVTVSSASRSSVTLRIGSLMPEDVGNYTCTASNQYGSDSVTATLVVNDSAPKIQAFSFSPDLSLGDTAVVTCAVKRGSKSPHTLSWLIDARGLSEDHRVSASRQSDMLSTLTIRDVGPDDVGNYSCVARNARGEDTFTAPLAVSGTHLQRFHNW